LVTGAGIVAVLLMVGTILFGVGSMIIRGTPSSAEVGDCIEPLGGPFGSYVGADCAGAPYQVLERFDERYADCTLVPGVTWSYAEYKGTFTLCLGPPDVDPATAVNAADVGDCLAGVDARTGAETGEVSRVGCADPAATARVLGRTVDIQEGSYFADCRAAGSTAEYEWSLDARSNRIYFCLGPTRVAP
jgi:hypothetical protein